MEYPAIYHGRQISPLASLGRDDREEPDRDDREELGRDDKLFKLSTIQSAEKQYFC